MKYFIKYLKNIKRLNRSYSSLLSINHYHIYKTWVNQIKSKQQPLELQLPWITIVASNYLEKYLINNRSKGLKVFEFGSGGSSLFFLKWASEVISVEHDNKWHEILENTTDVRNGTNWKNNLILPELEGATLNMDKQADNPHDYYTAAEEYLGYSFKSYVSFIDNYPDNYFDIVLIDGRSRPSCIYHSYKKIKKGGLLVLDNAERKRYNKSEHEYLKEFKLVLDHYGALVSMNSFTKTNIYLKK